MSCISESVHGKFGHIGLCGEDSQLLFQINLKLRVSERESVKEALTQFSTSILEDFPPEIVLQRSELFHVCLHLLA